MRKITSNSEKKSPKKKIRCLIIQLARMSDSLQSLMALRAAKQLYPDLELHFVVREGFGEAARRVPWLDGVTTLPAEKWLSPILKGQLTETQMLGEVARWASPLLSEPWDIVVNWSYSEASSHLASLIPSRVKLGFTRRRGDGTLSCPDGWSQYIQAIVKGGIQQNIHLTDILTTQLLTALQIHAGEPSDGGDVPVTSRSFFNTDADGAPLPRELRDPSRKWIAIQLGVHRGSQPWTLDAWSKLAGYILSRHPDYSLVLIGDPTDQPAAAALTERIRANGQPTRILNLIGELDFDRSARLIGRCQWAIAADSPLVQLAGILGTRVLNLSIGQHRWEETGPYGNGHYIVASATSDLGAPLGFHGTDLSPEAVYAAFSYASSEWSHRRNISIEEHFANLGWSSELGRTDIFRSKIRAGSEGGGVVYDLLPKRQMRFWEWTSQVMGHIARHWYCGWVPGIGKELSRERLSPALLQSLRELGEASDTLSKICGEAQKTAVALKQKSSQMKSDKIMRLADREELRDLGKRLIELERLIERVVVTSPALSPFVLMSKVLMHNLRGEQLADLGKETAISYQQLHQGIAIYRDWITHTLKLSRPVALRPLISAETSNKTEITQ